MNVVEQLQFAQQIACGMEYLASKGYVHRDVSEMYGVECVCVF